MNPSLMQIVLASAAVGAVIASFINGIFNLIAKNRELKLQEHQQNLAIAAKLAEIKHQQVLAVQDWTLRSGGKARPADLWDPRNGERVPRRIGRSEAYRAVVEGRVRSRCGGEEVQLARQQLTRRKPRTCRASRTRDQLSSSRPPSCPWSRSSSATSGRASVYALRHQRRGSRQRLRGSARRPASVEQGAVQEPCDRSRLEVHRKDDYVGPLSTVRLHRFDDLVELVRLDPAIGGADVEVRSRALVGGDLGLQAGRFHFVARRALAGFLGQPLRVRHLQGVLRRLQLEVGDLPRAFLAANLFLLFLLLVVVVRRR